MKRVKESGAPFRRKKKAEEKTKKNEGAPLKFIKKTFTTEVEETKSDNHAETSFSKLKLIKNLSSMMC